ncbi:helicase associated domain-containing protein [Streptomyces sp. MMBL 11-3]|uniref:helicase associated domain-containing protein n=1 Tax=Streptomyces sp. MMBL 11-3 TaxID=3382639 RepID=UPI0039B60CD1
MDKLMPAQQYLLETLGIEPPAEGEVVVPVRRSQDERRNTNLTAARPFHAHEGHLRPARKHIEDVDGEPIKLGAFVDNSRDRATTLSPERRAALDGLGMRC